MLGHIPDPVLFTHDIVAFIQALHKVDLQSGPASNRGVPLEKKDAETRKALQELTGMVDIPAITALWEKALKVPPMVKTASLGPWRLIGGKSSH